MDERLERYADLCVRVGANVQPGQELFVDSLIEHAPLTRAIARQGYRAGAAYVHVPYGDPHTRHAMMFMVGGPDLEVDALLADGTEVPVIRGEVWQLPR
jgi:leucyl aminopeptidase (aminopeptidase T)